MAKILRRTLRFFPDVADARTPFHKTTDGVPGESLHLVLVPVVSGSSPVTAPATSTVWSTALCFRPNPQRVDGENCRGPTRAYQTCNTQPCPVGSRDFRTLQCSFFNGQRYKGRMYQWNPYYSSSESRHHKRTSNKDACALVCYANSPRPIVVKFSQRVVDGTTCGNKPKSVCVAGSCVPLGCDNRLNSQLEVDRCGVCGGENRNCASIAKTISFNIKSGYTELLEIPRGARHIKIAERPKSRVTLALKNKAGIFFFNARPSRSHTTQTKLVAGAIMYYYHPIHSGELFRAEGPINESLMVVGFSHKQTSHVTLSYEYTHIKPRSVQHGKKTSSKTSSSSNKGRSSYPWQSLLYQQVLSGKGMVGPKPKSPASRLPSVSSHHNHFNTSSWIRVDDVHSSGSKPKLFDASKTPVVTNERRYDSSPPRQTHPGRRTKPRVEMTTVKEVVREVARTRETETKRFLNNQDRGDETQRRGKEEIRRNSKFNANPNLNANHVPKLHRKRNRKEKKQNRKSTALEHLKHDEVPVFVPRQTSEPRHGKHHGAMHSSNTGRVDPQAKKVHHRERTHSARKESGRHRVSEDFVWRPNKITPCSSTCEPGVQMNFFSCFNNIGNEVSDSHCDQESKPESSHHACTRQPCTPRWVTSTWGSCLASCGDGVQTRTVRCWQMMGPGFDSTVHDYRCSSRTKPPTERPCRDTSACEARWEISGWDKCSSECGYGIQTRHVLCNYANAVCDADQKPSEERSCRNKPCINQWYSSAWSSCSGTCGVRYRKVYCRDVRGRILEDTNCDFNTKPLTVHACGKCKHNWVPQEWGECSVTCGEGVKSRRVICGSTRINKFHIQPDSYCQAIPRPKTVSKCRGPPCGSTWYTTEWSECSQTCGRDGLKTRDVRCHNRDGIPDCDYRSKPHSTDKCNLPPCQDKACRDDGVTKCHRVVTANLCSHWFYQDACCETCKNIS
ncbi:thrombospondin type-1 domain-containing protein 4-like [Gigantopelta aegis]|uniref:thrombospondin type-1 domain-containing protein 4-like n=1 Tax=Gigantopelta aegis TaxID=1735272 RepID=UPI001B889031|nr:thrombospondin type-1 domain-containing protein 4-like [Gigantopelta aegis]